MKSFWKHADTLKQSLVNHEMPYDNQTPGKHYFRDETD